MAADGITSPYLQEPCRAGYGGRQGTDHPADERTQFLEHRSWRPNR